MLKAFLLDACDDALINLFLRLRGEGKNQSEQQNGRDDSIHHGSPENCDIEEKLSKTSASMFDEYNFVANFVVNYFVNQLFCQHDAETARTHTLGLTVFHMRGRIFDRI